MSEPLFDPRLVYPCDYVGPYVELEGKVVGTGEPLFDSFEVTIETEHGRISGWADDPFLRIGKKAERARVRVYRSGGGFYPDNQVVSMSARRE